MKDSPWHHRPPHVFLPNMFYCVTAGTLHKQHLFRGAERLNLLQEELFAAAKAYEWILQAWAIFSNHYHFVAQAPANAASLRLMLQRVAGLHQLDQASPAGKCSFIETDAATTPFCYGSESQPIG